MACAHRFKCHGNPLHLPILHPHCPVRELPRQQVWLWDILAFRVQHLQKGGDAVTWRERKSKRWKAEQGKEAHWSKGMKKTQPTTQNEIPKRVAGPICLQLLPLVTLVCQSP